MMAFARPDETIAAEVEKDVIRRVLMLDPADIDIEVTDGIVRLSGEVPNRSDARLLEELTGRLEGVTRVDADLNWVADDTKHPESPSVWR
jgi:osmotically-inducible protein OsmY